MNSDDLTSHGSEPVGIAPRSWDPAICGVSFLAIGAGILAVALGWTVAGTASIVFGLLTVWLAAQFAAAPACADEEPREG